MIPTLIFFMFDLFCGYSCCSQWERALFPEDEPAAARLGDMGEDGVVFKVNDLVFGHLVETTEVLLVVGPERLPGRNPVQTSPIQ